MTLNYPKSAAMGFFSKALKNEFETAIVNELSVFEPLMIYCTVDDETLVHLILPQKIRKRTREQRNIEVFERHRKDFKKRKRVSE